MPARPHSRCQLKPSVWLAAGHNTAVEESEELLVEQSVTDAERRNIECPKVSVTKRFFFKNFLPRSAEGNS